MSARTEIQPGERRLLPSGRLVQVLGMAWDCAGVVSCRYVGGDGKPKGAGFRQRNEVNFVTTWFQKYGVRV